MDMNLIIRSIEGCPDCRKDEVEGIILCAFHVEVAEDMIKEQGVNILNKLKQTAKHEL